MKNLLIILFSTTLFISCSKEIIYDDIAPQLEIIVKSETGQFVTDAKVSIFTTEEDWRSNLNEIKSGNTNEQGSIIFTNLEEIRYYFYVVKNEMTNNNQISEIKEPLKKNVKAIIETTIK